MRDSYWIHIGWGIHRIMVKGHIDWVEEGGIPLAILYCKSQPQSTKIVRASEGAGW